METAYSEIKKESDRLDHGKVPDAQLNPITINGNLEMVALTKHGQK